MMVCKVSEILSLHIALAARVNARRSCIERIMMKFCPTHNTHEYWLSDGRCGYCADCANGRQGRPIDITKETGNLWHCVKHGTHRYWMPTCGYCFDEKPKPIRPSIDEYFMTIAHAVATRATCPRASVGAVLVRDKRILTTGYNGSCTGLPSCLEAKCLMVDDHCARSVHAEINAIIQAALHGVSTAGATCYATHYPCLTCAKSLINAGVVRVVYHEGYRVSDHAALFFVDAGVELVRL
jgi:dCMP deaminase